MKNLFLLGATTLLLSSCATLGSDCIDKALAGGQAVNFGSDEASQAYKALPLFYTGPNQEENARLAVNQITAAIEKFDLSPEAETKFLRTRLAANRKLQEDQAARADVRRLIALDRLNKNEGPYLLAELEAPTPAPANKADRDAQPLVRIPPIFSQAALQGNKSGHCVLKFDVSKVGTPKNIRVGYCTDERFRDSSIRSLEKWKYNPAIRDQKAVERKDVVTNIRYVIQDSCGTILPE